MRRRILKLIADIIIVILIGGWIFYVVTWYGFQKERGDAKFGVTFSTVMARQLGLEPREVFDAIIDDLGARKIRIPIYWSDIEKQKGEYDFSDYDYFIKQAERKNAKLILAVGRKLPRWPECHEPEWAQMQNAKIKMQNSLNYIETVVERYKNSSAVEMWQVENEPFFRFGAECAKETLTEDNIRQEAEQIKSLDLRPVMITDSGEQGLWYKAARNGDILGITMYRQTWNPVFKVVRFPLGPRFYRIKASLLRGLASYYEAKPRSQKIMVVELQAEPWGPGKLLPDYDVKIQKELMGVEKFRENISFARRTGFDTFYLWGAEWWYWLKETQNDSSLWNEARNLFARLSPLG